MSFGHLVGAGGERWRHFATRTALARSHCHASTLGRPRSRALTAESTRTRLCQSVSCWEAGATLRTLASANGRAWAWNPMGKPLLSNPQDTLTDGSPI